jgi:amino acid transporter
VIPKRFFGQLEPKRNTPRNNILLTSSLMLMGALLLTYQFGAELLNYGAFIAFMGVNLASAKRMFVDSKSKTLLGRLLGTLLPVAGFLVCLGIWWGLRPVAKIAGTVWLAIGFVYCAIRTNGFRNRLELVSSPDED